MTDTVDAVNNHRGNHTLLIQCSPQQHGSNRTEHLMLWVMGACLPAIAIATWFFGYGMLLNICLASVFAVALEALVLRLRTPHWRQHLRDNSALVTAVLLGIAIPPGSAWWLVLLGIAFAIVIAKHAYGGLGQNPFNPAMCGYALLLLSFPLDMTAWHIPLGSGADATLFSPLSFAGLKTSLLLSFPFLAPGPLAEFRQFADGFAMATPLIEQKMAGRNAIALALEGNANLFARSSATGWALINIGFLCGGVALLYKRFITWHIPLSIIGTIGLVSVLFYSEGSSNVVGTPYLHLFGSATMMGAFFIATDPVSAASTPLGKLVYGCLIGVIIYCIRVWGSYLDSVAFAVLLGNFCAPLIDHLTQPRIYGHPSRFQLWKR